MKINEVESLVGITKKNIRFYEEKGLLSPGRNSENGYRDYGQAEVDALRRIKLLRKLGVPIEEIRRMQQQNLEEAVKLCELLKERTEPLSELDAQSVLEEMEKLEQTGTTFQNKQRQDVRIRYVAPVAITAVLVAVLAAFMGVFIWTFVTYPADSPPLAVLLLVELVPGLAICGILYALFQRIEEIGKGEIDDAKKY